MADKKEARKVKGREPVTIEYLEGAKFHKAGNKSVVHELVAKKLVAAKKAKIVKE